jgi:hypothetical protein
MESPYKRVSISDLQGLRRAFLHLKRMNSRHDTVVSSR